MKTLLFLSWLILGSGSYLGYGYYNDTVAKRAASDSKLTELASKNTELQRQNDGLKTELELEKKVEDSLRQAAIPQPTTIIPAAPETPTQVSAAVFVFPATITTVHGKTYYDCKLDRADPDGVAFIHSTGAAKVPYTELDPSFSKEFGYDPAKALAFQQDNAVKAGQRAASRLTTAQAASEGTEPKPQADPERIQAIQRQINALLLDAQNLDRLDQQKFEDGAYKKDGEIEHHWSMEHNPQAQADRDQAKALQDQVSQMNGN